ncbi:MAG: SPOR domain-containing protein [Alphaproteobacteria bacterium]|nr:SPOR domain-containing protein [Alphaproteobacteria bacterium]
MARRDNSQDDFDEESFLDSLLKRKNAVPMPPSMARLLMGVAGLAVVATIAAVTWATWPGDKSRVDEDTLPIMRADPSSYKIKPEDPGGMMVPNKDSTIFETLNDGKPDRGVENLLDEPEQPVKKEDVFPKEEEVSTYKVVSEDAAADEPAPQPKATPEPVQVKEPLKETVKEQVKEKPAPAKMTTGKSYVQFAAVKSDADAKAKWSKLQTQYGVLKGLPLNVQKADLGTKGTFYRVQAGPMSLDQAQSLCTKIKSAKGDCLVIK